VLIVLARRQVLREQVIRRERDARLGHAQASRLPGGLGTNPGATGMRRSST
jgi:hypothetical protein